MVKLTAIITTVGNGTCRTCAPTLGLALFQQAVSHLWTTL